MKERLRSLAPALALLALASGCPSISTMGTARTVPEGTTQFYTAASYGSMKDTGVSDTGTPQTLAVPGVELGARHGVNDWMEVGAKVFPVGAEVNAKFQIHRSATTDHGFDLAVSPALSVYPYSGGVFGWGQLSLPVGFNVGGGNQLVLSPRAAYMKVFAPDGSGEAFYAGGSMGFAMRMGRGGMQVLPELSAVIPISKKLPTSVAADFALEGPIVQFGIGFLFGP